MKMTTQTQLLQNMEKDFQITRKIFLNIKTGWFDKSKNRSNLVCAKDISIDQIQGRYRLNVNDNKLYIQEFFFDLEWSTFTEEGNKIELITKEIVNSYFPRLKKAAKKLLFLLLKYIPKELIYIRASGSGLHIVFFLEKLNDMDEWEMITRYLIKKSKLPDTKHAKCLVFGLDKDTILSSDRKISEFGSWNKLKKDLKKEVNYLNYATYLTVDDFFKAKDYPFCSDIKAVKYPDRFKYIELPPRLLADAVDSKIENPIEPAKDFAVKDLRPAKNFIPVKDLAPVKDELVPIKKCPAYYSILRKRETEWYERHFLVKFLKYTQKMSMKEILDLFDNHACWSDYKSSTTRYYVKKHFREGTCETKVKKPPRKKTLIKYNLCIDKCNYCVYTKERQDFQ